MQLYYILNTNDIKISFRKIKHYGIHFILIFVRTAAIHVVLTLCTDYVIVVISVFNYSILFISFPDASIFILFAIALY